MCVGRKFMHESLRYIAYKTISHYNALIKMDKTRVLTVSEIVDIVDWMIEDEWIPSLKEKLNEATESFTDLLPAPTLVNYTEEAWLEILKEMKWRQEKLFVAHMFLTEFRNRYSKLVLPEWNTFARDIKKSRSAMQQHIKKIYALYRKTMDTSLPAFKDAYKKRTY